MKIKDTLDLCGWELLNFCIQNHQNLEGLLDLGAGRKVFYTGNDQGKNGREVIYDGSKWKVSAYMSDVDELRGLITALENATDEEIEALKGRATTLEGRATTTEGNLATLRSEFDALNKALNEDTAGTIDTWNEIQNFVGKYDGSEDLETILSRMNAEIDGKLNLAGGTINGLSYNPLIIKSDDSSLIQVSLYADESLKGLLQYNINYGFGFSHYGIGGIYVNGDGKPTFVNNSSETFILLHSGNFAAQIGDYYLKTDGSNVMGKDAYISWNTSSEDNDVADWDTVTGRGLRIISSSSATSNAPDQYSTALHVKGRYGFQLAVKGGNLPSFHIRSAQSGANTWREILHSGNYSNLITTLNGNLSVAGAVNVGEGGLNVEGITSLKDRVLIKGVNDDGRSALSLAGALKVCRNTSSKDTFLEVTSGDTIVKYMGHDSLDGFCSHDFYSHDKLLLHISATNATSQFYTKLAASGLITASGGLHIPTGQSFKIGEATLSWDADKNALKVDKNIYSDGEVSAGGAATEGEGGAGGFSLYESWGTSAPTEPLALGANLGWELKTRVEDLELAKTKVTFEPALVSGKQIGAITIDGNKTNLFAPATYAWSEITSKPTTLAGYGITDGMIYNKTIKINGEEQPLNEIGYGQTGNGWPANGPALSIGFSQAYWAQIQLNYTGGLYYRYSMEDGVKGWFRVLDERNYATVLNNTYLPLTGGRLDVASYNSFQINCTTEDGAYSYFQFLNKGSRLGYLGFSAVATPAYMNTAGDVMPLLHKGNYVDLIGDTYLKTTGGTISGTGYDILTIKSSSTAAALKLKGSDATKGGYLIYGGSTDWRISDDGWTISYTLLHSGNFSNYAAKYDDGASIDAARHSIGYDNGTHGSENLKTHGGYISFGHDSYGGQLLGQPNGLALYYRGVKDNAFSAWKTIAFTDSDITGNAATATKLKKSVTLWGNTFDGTQNLGGKITLNNNTSVDFYSSDAQKTINAVSVSNANVVAFGWGAIQHGFGSNFYGKSLTFTAGEYASRATAMTITEERKVLINSSAVRDRRLCIGNGGVYISAIAIASPVLGSVGSNSLLVGSADYGMQHWVLGNGQGNIQVGRFDGTATAYALNLNPLGGAVNIASANANTNVLGSLFASQNLYTNGYLMMNHEKEGIYMSGNSIHWHDKNDTYAAPLLSFASDSFTIYPNLYVKGLANFSSRVLIGAVTDDTESALQVSGKTKFFTNDNAYKLYTRINGSSIQIGRTSSSYTGGYNGGLQVGEDNTSFGYIAGAYNEGVGSSSVLFHYGGSNNNNASIYIKGLGGNVGIKTANPSCTLDVNGDARVGGTSTFGGQSTFNALALFNKPIVAKDTLQIGDATLMWDGNKKALVVDKSFASMGEISAGGTGTEGGNTGGGGTGTITNPDVEYYNPKDNATHTFYHNLPYYDVVVQVYEKNAISGAWDMILADVTIANESNLVTVNFGRKEDVEHKIVVR